MEAHQAAMEVWERLKNMDPETAREKAFDDGSEMNEVWATARISSMVLNGLKMAKIEQLGGEAAEDPDDEPEIVLWTRLYGRPLAKVYAFYVTQRERKPEMRMTALTKFAKGVKPLPESIDALLPHVREDIA